MSDLGMNTDQLLMKQFASGEQAPRYLDWDSLPELPAEARLSQLTRWCLDAANERRSYGLRLPGKEIAPATGPAHLHDCLQSLALYGEHHS